MPGAMPSTSRQNRPHRSAARPRELVGTYLDAFDRIFAAATAAHPE